MKSLLVVLIMSLVYLVVITVLFRTLEIHRRAALMVQVFLSTLPFFIVIHTLTPPDLGFLPSTLTELTWWIDLSFGLLVYFAAFFGGILQLYNLAERGFSLRILIDIDEAADKALTLAEILQGYSRGRGIEWMYQKRIEGLVEHALVQVKQGAVQLRDKGSRTAALFSWLRTFLQLDADAW